MFVALKKKTVLLIAFLIITVIIFSVFGLKSNAFAVYLNGTSRKLPIYSVERDDNKISITFDCAYGVDYTYKILDVLDEYNVKCTFFAVEFWVDKYPESVKQLSDAGHQIQNHSNTHPYMTGLSTEQMIDELKSCNKKIENITGKCPTLFRPPYGDYDNRVVETVENIDMYTIQWDCDSLDWKDNATPDSICKRVTSKVKNGSIVLFHIK